MISHLKRALQILGGGCLLYQIGLMTVWPLKLEVRYTKTTRAPLKVLMGKYIFRRCERYNEYLT